jgi:hypothetical protein
MNSFETNPFGVLTFIVAPAMLTNASSINGAQHITLRSPSGDGIRFRQMFSWFEVSARLKEARRGSSGGEERAHTRV